MLLLVPRFHAQRCCLTIIMYTLRLSCEGLAAMLRWHHKDWQASCDALQHASVQVLSTLV